MVIFLLLAGINLLAWYPVLSFWFFQSWEATWLIGNCGQTVNPICLMQGHALLYYLDYRIFGWNPWGWYLTTLLLHIVAVFLIYKLVAKLTHQNLFAFIVALLFSANITYYDVLTWGSFNGLYALIMDFFLAASIFYLKITENVKKKVIWFMLIAVMLSVGLFVRESSLILPAFILIVYFYKHDFRLTKKDTLFFLKTIIPLFIIIGIYFYIRKTYGGPSYDYIDETVQYRVRLLAQGLYFDYFRRTVMLIGVMIAPQAIPFQVLNFVREHIAAHFHPNKVQLYFFPLAGYFYMAVQGIILFKNWKNKKIRNLLLFGFFWTLLPAIAASLPISFTDEVFKRVYNENTPSRGWYFGSFGTSVFWVAAFWALYDYCIRFFKQYSKYVSYSFAVLVALVVFSNLLVIHGIESEVYKTSYKPEKDFYTAFRKDFPTLPKDYIFYVFPGSGSLKDYLSEWYHVRNTYYPTLTEERGYAWEESHMAMLFQRLIEKSADLNSTFFITYDYTTGLVDKTLEARKVIRSMQSYSYEVNQNVLSSQSADFTTQSSAVSVLLKPKLHVEIPYTVKIGATANPTGYSNHANPEMEAYVADRLDFLGNASVKVCNTSPIGNKPAYHLNPNNLIDGNIGQRSYWIADCRPAWVIIDLGKEKKIAGIAFHSGLGPELPAHYTVEVSSDGSTWVPVEDVSNNTIAQRIDVFQTSVSGRYVKYTALQTSEGAMLALDELEVLGDSAIPAVKRYGNDFEKLLQDSYLMGGIFMRFSWETDPNNFTPADTIKNNSYYLPIIADGTEHGYVINPNEGEYFSNTGQFLTRYITKMHVDFLGLPSSIFVSHLEIDPRFNLSTEGKQ